MKNYMNPVVGILCLVSLVYNLSAQSPSCKDLTIAIERDDSATIVVGDFVNNADLIPDFSVILRNQNGGILKIVPNANAATTFRFYACPHVGRRLTLHAESAGGEVCMSNIQLHEDFLPIILGRKVTVWCDDTLTNEAVHIDGVPPTALIPCQGERPSSYTADWVDVFPCASDTAKIIYRMYEAYGKNDNRATGQDTIIVRRFPEITDNSLTCNMTDTISCDTLGQVGPYLTLPDRVIYFVETFRNASGQLDFKAAELDPACGISVSVKSEAFNGDCPQVYKVTAEIKQTCPGSGEGYFICEFWVTEVDTTPPTLEILRTSVDWDQDTLRAKTSGHGCVAQITLPAVFAKDDCHAVTLVKAIVGDQGSYTLSKQLDGTWAGNQLIEFPSQPEPVQVIYEALDECHLVGRDTFYIGVKDRTSPIAISNKLLNLSLSGKKAWMDAEAFNQGSWDNCGIEALLVRRTDWEEACIDLCKDFDFTGGNFYQNYYQHLDTLGPVGSHYANTLKWLSLDPSDCNEFLLNGWLYDLHRYVTVTCQGQDQNAFEQQIGSLIPDPVVLDETKLLGGGWSPSVPFSCEDLCDTVTVELLVVDYWCNWNKTWTKVWVEDKTPVSIGQKADEEIEISCFAYQDERYLLAGQPVALSTIVEQAHQGQEEALALLNQIFGGYQKAWLGDRGEFIDSNGVAIDTEIDFINKQCDCRDTTASISYVDSHGQTATKDSTWRICDYVYEDLTFNSGILLVNCPEIVECQEEVWTDIDDCGIGTIFRKFTIRSGCAGQNMVPTEVTQVIQVTNECPLDSGMFRFPLDAQITSCGLIFEADGSGHIGGPAHPDSTGRPEFIFDSACYIVGIGYTDKALEVVPQTEDGPCYKIIRTWCLIDWCGISDPPLDWQSDPTYAHRVIKYDQYIKVFCECPCLLNCSDLSDTTIACEDIPLDLTELYVHFGVPTIESPDTTQPCDGTLDSQTEIDTNECGIGSIVRTWYLIDPLGKVADSCKQSIIMAPPPIEIQRTNLYKGDAEPFNCSDSIITEPVTFDFDACPLFGTVVISNDSPYAVNDSNDASGVYPVGEHIVTYTISSNCFATFQEVDTIQVIDDVNPTVSVFSDPCVTKSEWLNDFQNDPLNPNIRMMLALSASDNCAVDTILLVDLDSMFFPDQVIRDSILYTYDWQAVDVNGNLSSIETATILVSDLCTVSADIRGLVVNENQQSVHEVMIKAMTDDGTLLEYPADAGGHFIIEPEVEQGIMIQPSKNNDPKNGLSTADVIIMRDYILGVRPIENDFRKIAADVNNDGKINPIDIVQLRKMILGTIDQFPESESWRFVNDINGEPQYHVYPVDAPFILNFTGIKIGDLDQSYDRARRMGRSRPSTILRVLDQQLESGKTYSVVFNLPDIQQLRGAQFTLQTDPAQLEVIDVAGESSTGMSEENFALRADKPGFISVSWDNIRQTTTTDLFFTLTFYTLKDCRLSDVITINSSDLAAEAYDQSLQVLDLALQFEGQIQTKEFSLKQNKPNPFTEQTTIVFELPRAMSATIRIFDVTGRLQKIIRKNYDQGQNEIVLNANDFSKGILYYQLEAGGFVETRKMILSK